MRDKFEEKSFSNLSSTPEGKELVDSLWSFFNEPNSLIRFETASYLRRPALEPLQPELEHRFGQKFEELRRKGKFNRWKQMMGSMVLQVMGSHGYEIDARQVKIRIGSLFTVASRYKMKTNEGEK